jgi:hypothetical protein
LTRSDAQYPLPRGYASEFQRAKNQFKKQRTVTLDCLTLTVLMNNSGIQSMTQGQSQRVLLAGSTGYMGKKVLAELVGQGYDVVCPVRPPEGAAAKEALIALRAAYPNAEFIACDLTDPHSLRPKLQDSTGVYPAPWKAVISCISARGGRARRELACRPCIE